MGVFNLPAPVFAWFDQQLAILAPASIRLAIWGVIAASVSMTLYWVLSPQQKIARTKRESQEARRKLNDFDGEFPQAWPLIQNSLRLAAREVGLVTWPAIVASLPLLCLIVWLHSAYAHFVPDPDKTVGLETFPAKQRASWLTHGDDGQDVSRGAPRIALTNIEGNTAEIITLSMPITSVYKYQWWNALFGNPVGYLTPDTKVDRVRIDLPRREYLSFGPAWMRTWETLFFSVLVVVSIAVRFIFHIQ